MDYANGAAKTCAPEPNPPPLPRAIGSLPPLAECSSPLATGLVAQYLAFTDDLPSPQIFRLWTAIHAVGAAAERRVWTRSKINKLHPNLFVFLVGPPGVGKSQALNPMTALLRKSQAVTMAPNDISKQSLLDCLSAASKGALLDGAPFDYHFLAICISELSNFMSKYDLDLTGLLTDLYDCPDINEESKRTHDKGKAIAFPGLSFIMGSATQNLGNTITNELWGSGFMARVIVVFSADEIVLDDFFAVNDHDEVLGEEIAMGLRKIGGFKGPMAWEREAQRLLNHFQKNKKEGAPLHNRLSHYVTRRGMHLGKLCMIAALSDLSMTVTAEHFHTALRWLTEAEAEMAETFKDMVSHQDGQIFEELRTAMFALHMRAKKPIHVSVMYEWLSKRTAVHNIQRMIDISEASDNIRRVAGTSGADALYIPQGGAGVRNLGVL